MRTASLIFPVVFILQGPAAADPIWTQLTPAAPLPTERMAHVALNDAGRERMLVIGGVTLQGLKNDVWQFDLEGPAAWLMLEPAGTPPEGRWDHAAALDTYRDRVLLFGGQGSTDLADVWELSLSGAPAWNQISPAGTGPGPRVSHTAVYDPIGDQLIVFGGHDGIHLRNDAWALRFASGATWVSLTPAGIPPVPRRDHVALYDSRGRKMIVHGGNDGDAGFLNDVWSLDLDGPMAWQEVTPEGVLPEGAITHAATLDPLRDRLIISGGNYNSDVWALPMNDPTEWIQLIPGGSLPPGRIDHTAVFDAPRNRMVIFGGHTGLLALQDCWELAWAEPAAVDREPVPRPGLSASVIENPARGVCEILYSMPAEADVRLRLFDVLGRLVSEEGAGRVPAGAHVWRWDGRSIAGAATSPTAVYFYEVETTGSASSRRERVTDRFVLSR